MVSIISAHPLQAAVTSYQAHSHRAENWLRHVQIGQPKRHLWHFHFLNSSRWTLDHGFRSVSP